MKLRFTCGITKEVYIKEVDDNLSDHELFLARKLGEKLLEEDRRKCLEEYRESGVIYSNPILPNTTDLLREVSMVEEKKFFKRMIELPSSDSNDYW